jgi:hypothetical protein
LQETIRSIGQLIFEPDGTVLPADNQTGQVNPYYHLEDLDSVLDILRNEKKSRCCSAAPVRAMKTAFSPVKNSSGKPSAMPSDIHLGQGGFNVARWGEGAHQLATKARLRMGTQGEVLSSSWLSAGPAEW